MHCYHSVQSITVSTKDGTILPFIIPFNYDHGPKKKTSITMVTIALGSGFLVSSAELHRIYHLLNDFGTMSVTIVY